LESQKSIKTRKKTKEITISLTENRKLKREKYREQVQIKIGEIKPDILMWRCRWGVIVSRTRVTHSASNTVSTPAKSWTHRLTRKLLPALLPPDRSESITNHQLERNRSSETETGVGFRNRYVTDRIAQTGFYGYGMQTSNATRNRQWYLTFTNHLTLTYNIENFFLN